MVLCLSSTRIVSYCSCALEWWDVRTPGAILNVFDFLDYFPRLLVSFASLAELLIPYCLSNSCGLSVIYPCFSADIALFSADIALF